MKRKILVIASLLVLCLSSQVGAALVNVDANHVLDTATQYVWTRNANVAGNQAAQQTWANTRVDPFTLGGGTFGGTAGDWKLPSIAVLHAFFTANLLNLQTPAPSGQVYVGNYLNVGTLDHAFPANLQFWSSTNFNGTS